MCRNWTQYVCSNAGRVPAALILVAGCWSVTQPLHGQSATLTVGVYDYAGVPHEVLSRAEEDAARILSRAGVKVKWMACPRPPEDAARGFTCTAIREQGGLFINVLRNAQAKQLGRPHSIYGETVHPSVAYVFAEKARTTAVGRGVPEHTVLGIVLVHEVGHLLLGPGSHSKDASIMSDGFCLPAFRRAAQGQFPLFTPHQARLIQTRLSERASAVK